MHKDSAFDTLPLEMEERERDEGIDMPFSDSTKKLIELAKDEARLHGHSIVGAWHLLAAILRLPDTEIAKRALGQLGLDLSKVRSATEDMIGRGHLVVWGGLDLMLHAKRALDLAAAEAIKQGSGKIEPRHLLLGLISEGETKAVEVLINCGLKVEEVRSTLVELYSIEKAEGSFQAKLQDLLENRTITTVTKVSALQAAAATVDRFSRPQRPDRVFRRPRPRGRLVGRPQHPDNQE